MSIVLRIKKYLYKVIMCVLICVDLSIGFWKRGLKNASIYGFWYKQRENINNILKSVM